MLQVFTKTLGWAAVQKECGPVLGRNSRDAELGGCGRLMENLCRGIDKRLHEQQML